MDNEKILDEFSRLCDPYSLYVIWGKSLYKVSCPFRVRLIVDCGDWKKGTIKYVQRVLVTNKLQMVYLIGDKAYHFYLFQILLP